MTTTLNVALLGYGYAGKTFHAPLIAGVSGLRLAAVGSSDAAKVRADWPDLPVSDDFDALLSQSDIDLAVIATPNDTHYDLARRALLAGRHVVVDKPFTLTVAEARQLAALAEQSGRLLSVFHNRRWDSDFLTLRQLLADNALGEVAHFESHFDRYRPLIRPRWRERASGGGGLWYDLGPHVADQALQLFGPPVAIYADLARQRQGAEAVDYCHVLLRYPRLRVILHASALVAGGSPRFTVHGDAGSYIKYGLDTQEDALKAGQRPGGPDWGSDPRDGVLTRATGDNLHSESYPTLPGDYRLYYAQVRDAIQTGAANPVPAEEAIAVMEVIERGLESAAVGRELPMGKGEE